MLFLQELFQNQMIYRLDILEDQHNCKKYNKNILKNTPPVDLHWFFEISIRTEKKIQLELKKNFS